MSGGVPAVLVDWPDGLNAMLKVDSLCDQQDLPMALLELVRLWCSILNDCAFCIDMHRKKLVEMGVSTETLSSLEQRDKNRLDDQERAAIIFASKLTASSDDTELAAAALALSAHFERRHVVVLTYAIAQINAWNRLMRADKAMRR